MNQMSTKDDFQKKKIINYNLLKSNRRDGICLTTPKLKIEIP